MLDVEAPSATNELSPGPARERGPAAGADEGTRAGRPRGPRGQALAQGAVLPVLQPGKVFYTP